MFECFALHRVYMGLIEAAEWSLFLCPHPEECGVCHAGRIRLIWRRFRHFVGCCRGILMGGFCRYLSSVLTVFERCSNGGSEVFK